MARGKNKLRPGKGAVALVLTRFIKSAQPIQQSMDHRSYVVLEEEDKDDKGKKIYRFYYDGDEEKKMMWANNRYLKVEKEGKPELLFGGPGEARVDGFKEPRIKWQHSKARRLLVDDVKDGNVEFDDDDNPVLPIKDIFSMHPEYADYDFERFGERLLAELLTFRKLIALTAELAGAFGSRDALRCVGTIMSCIRWERSMTGIGSILLLQM